ncbi:hypothetical protein NVP1161O_079 [Vibrio phage 1.161.O._10N.261.48.C5]|nr:hypothetical protein NVP1161O_079 [Vibrio phage 1.161.O._10N.261.48.C5]
MSKELHQQVKEMRSNAQTRISNIQKAAILRTDRNKKLAEKRLRPIHGDAWEEVYRNELKVKAKLSSLELQISLMDPREIAEWIYELQNKDNTNV